jgi:hypothetical protein
MAATAGGLTGHEQLTDGLMKMLDDADRQMFVGTMKVAQEAGRLGRKAIEDTIDSTPSSLSPGKPDRNWTGEMRRSADSDVEMTGDTITVRAGWLVNQEEYFLTQERGGVVNGITVTPMRALQNAYWAMTRHLQENGVRVD